MATKKATADVESELKMAAEAESTLTEEEIKFFSDTMARVKYSVNVQVPIVPLNHELLSGTKKEALGICWATDDGINKPTPFLITIDEFFIHECFIGIEKPYMKLIPESLEQVIAHEIAHTRYLRHGKRHTELANRLLYRIKRGEPHGFETSDTVSAPESVQVTIAAMQPDTETQQ